MGRYDPDSAYWVFETLTNLVNLFYTNTIDDVHSVWEQWEDKCLEMQPTIEQVASELYSKDPKLAVEFLTCYSNSKGIEAIEIARNLTSKLLTKIARHNSGI
jgi:dipeptidase